MTQMGERGRNHMDGEGMARMAQGEEEEEAGGERSRAGPPLFRVSPLALSLKL